MLTQREAEIAKLIAQSHTNQEISQQLNISFPTVKTHIKSISSKLDVHNRTLIAVWAIDFFNLCPVIPPRTHLLTDREYEVATLVAEGLSNQEIAERLYLMTGTVKTHIGTIIRKLDVDNRTGIALWVKSRQGANYGQSRIA